MTKFARILTVFTVSFVFAAAKLPMTESELEKAAEDRDARNCPPGMHYVDRPHKCSFTCTEKGIKVWCDRSEKPGCVCPFEKYYNVDSNECMEVKCENMDCADHENEAFFHCESGSRESCLCSSFVTLDCRTGCQCKNGYCRDNGKCVKRKCKGSPFAEVYGN